MRATTRLPSHFTVNGFYELEQVTSYDTYSRQVFAADFDGKYYIRIPKTSWSLHVQAVTPRLRHETRPSDSLWLSDYCIIGDNVLETLPRNRAKKLAQHLVKEMPS